MSCPDCGHEHTGLDLGQICVGCPCLSVPAIMGPVTVEHPFQFYCDHGLSRGTPGCGTTEVLYARDVRAARAELRRRGWAYVGTGPDHDLYRDICPAH